MTTSELGIEEQDEILEENIVKSHYWELPEVSLGGWRPYTAVIEAKEFLGPKFTGYGKGLNLSKDLMGGLHGSRGSGKSLYLSFLLAKKMLSGRPVWTNYPISFYVKHDNGELTYHESKPLDFKKFYAFSPEVRKGAVGITELQYYVESRTSGKEQNRIFTYQIMQLRKTALSFWYDVQDRGWVDKRFGWSNDFDIECSDIAKMNYDKGSIGFVPSFAKDEVGDLREGALVHFMLEDTSGVLTGRQYRESQVQEGPFQLDSWKFWDIFPTHFIIDAYEAMHSLKKNNEKAEAQDLMANALENAINDFLRQEVYEVMSTDLWRKADEYAGQQISNVIYGRQMGSWGITKRQISSGKYGYNIGVLLEEKP